jgi:hypothetical protein
MTTIIPTQTQFLLGARFVCYRVVANPVADEKARSLERGAHVAVVVKNKKYQTPTLDIFYDFYTSGGQMIKIS